MDNWRTRLARWLCARNGKWKNCIRRKVDWTKYLETSPCRKRRRRRKALRWRRWRSERSKSHQNDRQARVVRLLRIAGRIRVHRDFPFADGVLHVHGGGIFRAQRRFADFIFPVASLALFVPGA